MGAHNENSESEGNQPQAEQQDSDWESIDEQININLNQGPSSLSQISNDEASTPTRRIQCNL